MSVLLMAPAVDVIDIDETAGSAALFGATDALEVITRSSCSAKRELCGESKTLTGLGSLNTETNIMLMRLRERLLRREGSTPGVLSIFQAQHADHTAKRSLSLKTMLCLNLVAPMTYA